MTLQDLLADCYRRCQLSPTPPANVQELFRGFINDTQQELSGDPALGSLLRGQTSFTTAAAIAEYGLPPVVGRVLSIRDTTHRRTLRAESRDWYRTQVPSPAQWSGTPDRYVHLGPATVARQPSDASDLFVKSTSALDVQILRYEAVVTGGLVRNGEVTLTGTTAVSLGVSTIESVTDWFLESDAAGTVTLLEDSGAGTELARIGIGTSRSTYQGIALAPTPSSALTYQVEYERVQSDLVIPDDSPAWLPEAFHRLLSAGARRRYWEDQNQATRYTQALTDFSTGLGRLKASVNNPPDYTLVPGTGRGGRSDLVGEYPAGTVFD